MNSSIQRNTASEARVIQVHCLKINRTLEYSFFRTNQAQSYLGAQHPSRVGLGGAAMSPSLTAEDGLIAWLFLWRIALSCSLLSMD